MYYVYELINLLGGVEYVGQTVSPKIRFGEHTRTKPGQGSGKFYNRQDISMHIVATYETETEARQVEYDLQIFWGLPTDRSKCGPRGVRSHSAKLTESKVVEIRKLLDQKISQKEIASKFNVSVMSISKIKNSKSWKHLD